MYTRTNAKNFLNHLTAYVPGRYRPFITWYTVQEYKKMGTQLYLSETGQSGFGINPDGEILSVFSKPGAYEGTLALQSALDKGGKSVLCFEGFLATWYTKLDFKVTERMAWNDEYAPANWDFQQWGRPNVLIMKSR